MTFAGKHIQIYDHEPTGKELIDTLTRLHESPTRLTPVTAQELEDQMNCGDPVQCLGIALLKHCESTTRSLEGAGRVDVVYKGAMAICSA